MLLQVQLTLLQKNFEGGALAPLAPPPRSAPGGAYSVISIPTMSFITPFGMVWTLHFYSVAMERFID